MQVRLNMNRLDTGGGLTPSPKPQHKLDRGKPTHTPGTDLPWTAEGAIQLDYRDDTTVWVWISDNLCVELSRDEVMAISDGFIENEQEG